MVAKYLPEEFTPEQSKLVKQKGHCVKSVKIRSFFWSVFFSIWNEYLEILRFLSSSVRMRENADEKKIRPWTNFTEGDCILMKTWAVLKEFLKLDYLIKNSLLFL